MGFKDFNSEILLYRWAKKLDTEKKVKVTPVVSQFLAIAALGGKGVPSFITS